MKRLLLRGAPDLLALPQALINHFARGDLVALTVADAERAHGLADFLAEAGVSELDLPTIARGQPYHEVVYVDAPGEPIDRAETMAPWRRLTAPPFNAERPHIAYATVREQLKSHFGLELPDLRPEKDRWMQNRCVGGPRSLSFPKHHVAFRGFRLGTLGLSGGDHQSWTLSLYRLEDGGYVVECEFSMAYLGEESYRFFPGLEPQSVSRARAAHRAAIDARTPLDREMARREMQIAIGDGLGMALTSAQVKEMYSELHFLVVERRGPLSDAEPAAQAWWMVRQEHAHR